MTDPIEECIGQQLRSISNIDAGMLPKKVKKNKTWRWWPYQHHKPTTSFTVTSHEDRIIAAIDKKRKGPRKSRQEMVEDLLSEGYRKGEVANLLKVHRKTIQRDVKKIKGRLRLCLELKKSQT